MAGSADVCVCSAALIAKRQCFLHVSITNRRPSGICKSNTTVIEIVCDVNESGGIFLLRLMQLNSFKCGAEDDAGMLQRETVM